MTKIRIEFGREERTRFISHLDLIKVFERAFRRIHLPIAFSEGFNPHPKMNFASALAVGVISDKEYLDVELTKEVDTEELARSLKETLPNGLIAHSIKTIAQQSPSLMGVVNRAKYNIEVCIDENIDNEKLTQAISNFLDQEEVIIDKWTKKGIKAKNIRPGIIELTGQINGNMGVFDAFVVIGSQGNIRPEEVMEAFQKYSGLKIDTDVMKIKRTGLFIDCDNNLKTPMDI